MQLINGWLDNIVLNRIANEALDQPDVRAVTFLDARQERLAHAGPSMLTVAGCFVLYPIAAPSAAPATASMATSDQSLPTSP